MIHLGLRVAFERTWHTVPSNTRSLFLFPCTHFKVKAVSCKNNIMKEKNNSSLLTTQQAEVWIAKLVPEEKQMLLDILVKDTSTNTNCDIVSPLTTKQLFHVGVHYSLPFVGFGFLDNFIMIIAGDYIDLTIGTALGISTMAAAALGNAISDVAGVGSAQFVESLTRKLGVPQPQLDPRQFTIRSTTWAINIGRAIGVTIGCLLGMVPLLFLPTSQSKKEKLVDEE